MYRAGALPATDPVITMKVQYFIYLLAVAAEARWHVVIVVHRGTAPN